MSDREDWMNNLPRVGTTVTRCFKATRPDGRDFYTGTVDYAAALASGEPITHPRPGREGAGGYLSVSVSPSDCTSMKWPCRLFEVEPVATWVPDSVGPIPDGLAMLPNKRACHSLRVVRELPAHEALGPQGVHVAALVDGTRSFTADEVERLVAAWDATGDAAWAAAQAAAQDAARAAAREAASDAAWEAAWDAVQGATWGVTRDVACDTVRALVVRDLISADHYDTLTMPWRAAIGPIHPDDPDTTIPKETP